ncbi:MAG: glycosyl transferase family 2, partial [Marinirhabdus sp.]
FTFFSVAMGFSVHNSIAVLEGHFGKKSAFVRTPKFNIKSVGDSWKGNVYVKNRFSPGTIIEGMLMLYFGYGMYSAFVVGQSAGDFGLFPFHLMLFLGFGFVFFKSLQHGT